MKRKKLTEADVTAESVFMLKRRQVLKMLGISATALSLPAAAQADLFTAAEFDADKAAHYAAIAFGCPSMGAEQLEESEFEPMFEAVKPALAGKKIALFGSYGWGGGEWMRTWEDDCAAAGLTLCAESVICQDEPDDAALAACAALGEALK